MDFDLFIIYCFMNLVNYILLLSHVRKRVLQSKSFFKYLKIVCLFEIYLKKGKLKKAFWHTFQFRQSTVSHIIGLLSFFIFYSVKGKR